MEINDIIIPLGLTFFAGFSTLIGSSIFLLLKKCEKKYLSFLMGLSAGVMIYLSFIELIPYSIPTLGMVKSNLLFFSGFIIMGVLDFVIPHHYIKEHLKGETEEKNTLLKTGMFVAFGLMIHNFPEGIAVVMSSLADPKLGLFLAFATAIHNIPEGIAVAVPIYYATKNRFLAFKYSFLSGIAEPLGAVLAVTILWPFLSKIFLSGVFAFVAGVMIFISFDELLPCCFKNGHGHTAIFGIAAGMMVMALSLILL